MRKFIGRWFGTVRAVLCASAGVVPVGGQVLAHRYVIAFLACAFTWSASSAGVLSAGQGVER